MGRQGHYNIALCVCSLSMQFFPDRFVRREILNFPVTCCNTSLGCDWEGTLLNYEVSVCMYMYIIHVYIYDIIGVSVSKPTFDYHSESQTTVIFKCYGSLTLTPLYYVVHYYCQPVHTCTLCMCSSTLLI